MSKLHPALLALALAGAASAAACGDDDKDTDTGSQTDGGGGTGGDSGSSTGGKDSSTGGGDSDGGVTENDADVPAPAAKCPVHPNVKDEDGFCVITAPLDSPITEDLDLTNVTDRGVLLSGPVFVGEDIGEGEGCADNTTAKTATLTIAAGTEVLAEDSGTFLLVQRGSRILAQGTKDAPIVFTTALAEKTPGSWGGLLINGRAPHNKGCDVNGEAGTGTYSGDKEDDNSGVVSYVRIEWGGAQINPENEFNGLTLSGVGSGTKIDHVHVHGCNDDGFEWFGGTVNAKYLVSTGNGDDGLDWTSGFRGKIQFAVVQQYPTISSTDPRGIEADNDRDNNLLEPISSPTFSNITLIGNPDVAVDTNADGVLLRRGTYGALHNVLAMNFKSSCVRLIDDATLAAVDAGDLAMKNSRIFCTKNFSDAPSETIFTEANEDAVLDSNDVLENALSYDADANFAPKAGSDLLTAGEAPSDAFFDKVTFIGAIGEDDWTKDGSWVNIP
jgi:trimeric autotransporter adhesin